VGALWWFIKFIVVVAVALVGAVFAMENSQPLTVSFILFNSPEISLGFWLLLFLSAGTLLGYFCQLGDYCQLPSQVGSRHKEGLTQYG
jgi:uncharacterized integral membrane protein